MQRALTPTLAIILAGGLAAGIGLARPATSEPVAAGGGVASATATPDGTEVDPDNPYRRGTRSAGERAASAEPAAPEAAAFTIEGFAFDGPTTVAPGATLTVTNVDAAPHTLTFTNGEVDTGDLAQGDSATVTAPITPGTYEFFCRIHPSMTGQLTVAG